MSQTKTTPENQLRSLAEGLLKKTKAGQVNWVRNSDEASYEVLLPQSRIRTWYTAPRAAPDTISLGFYNPKAELIGVLSANKPDPGDVPEADWPLLESLYAEVHRTVSGWDKVLAEVESAIASPGAIGEPRLPGLAGNMQSGIRSLRESFAK